jgi:ubiquinone/menaquinone biosynthesis C-methylase UbiE
VLSARLYDRALAGAERRALNAWRRELLQDVSGTVLEIGAGTGANLDVYGPSVSQLLLVEPDEAMRTRLAARASTDRSRNVVLAASASRLPLADSSVDAAVSTLVLCSVRQLDSALTEVHRVLKPGGRLHLIEHVAAEPGSVLRRAQGLVAPAWSRLAGGCSVVRPTRDLLAAAGFDVTDVRDDALPVPIPLVRPAVRGSAQPRLDAPVPD